jgi:hypothetical protein
MILDRNTQVPRGKKAVSDSLKQFEILAAEANTVREQDKAFIKGLFNNFYQNPMPVGIGFQRAYGSILSGDYFDLVPLPDGNYLFVFADISGHGLPAYTTLIKLRSSISLVMYQCSEDYRYGKEVDYHRLISEINDTFIIIMEDNNSGDYACVNFAFIQQLQEKYLFRFYNRSMLFPIVLHKENGRLKEVVNLNDSHREWQPQRGFIMGNDMKSIVSSGYYDTPYVDYYLNRGDSILFFSDGITEAWCGEKKDEFGEKRLMASVSANAEFPPQAIINFLFDSVYEFIGKPENQMDDMTAVLMDLTFPE